jgi:hypothetical protein
LGNDWSTRRVIPFSPTCKESRGEPAGNSRGISTSADRTPIHGNSAGRSYSDIGGVVRIGPPLGRLLLLGGSISFEDESPAKSPILVTDTALVADTSQALINRYTKHQTARLNALWGLRDVHFVRVSGFDALEGTQDLRTGFQLATLLGRAPDSFAATSATGSVRLTFTSGQRRRFPMRHSTSPAKVVATKMAIGMECSRTGVVPFTSSRSTGTRSSPIFSGVPAGSRGFRFS